MNRPRLVTITGIDRTTDLGRARALCDRYALEFAMVGDPEREGRNARVPEPGFLDLVARHLEPRQLAIHLCGDYSRMAISGDIDSLRGMFSFEAVRRVQINAPRYTDSDYEALRDFGERVGCGIIVQNAGPEIPCLPGLQVLDDQSAGQGRLPDRRAPPAAGHPAGGTDCPIGYAGGLTPDNLAAELAAIARANPSLPYWIDAASGARDADNRLDLDKVEDMLATAFHHPSDG